MSQTQTYKLTLLKGAAGREVGHFKRQIGNVAVGRKVGHFKRQIEKEFINNISENFSVFLGSNTL